MFKTLLVSAIALALSTQAAATTVMIDDFLTSQVVVVDVAGGGATSSATAAPANGEIWTTRSYSVEAFGAGIFAGDPAAVVTGGFFGINNDSSENSKVDLIWNIGAVTSLIGATNGALVLNFLNNNPANVVPTTVTFSFGSETLTANIPAIPMGSPIFSLALTNAQLALFAAGTNLTLSFTGGQGYDVVLDNLSISGDPAAVPLPGSLALLAAGFFGLGLKRKSRIAK